MFRFHFPTAVWADSFYSSLTLLHSHFVHSLKQQRARCYNDLINKVIIIWVQNANGTVWFQLYYFTLKLINLWFALFLTSKCQQPRVFWNENIYFHIFCLGLCLANSQINWQTFTINVLLVRFASNTYIEALKMEIGCLLLVVIIFWSFLALFPFYRNRKLNICTDYTSKSMQLNYDKVWWIKVCVCLCELTFGTWTRSNACSFLRQK